MYYHSRKYENINIIRINETNYSMPKNPPKELFISRRGISFI